MSILSDRFFTSLIINLIAFVLSSPFIKLSLGPEAGVNGIEHTNLG